MRIVIAGGPRCGKTTYSLELGSQLVRDLAKTVQVKHTDTLIKLHSWSEASEQVATWFDEPGPWIVEGVAAVRALRKWLQREDSAGKMPCDVVIWMDQPFVELNKGRASMLKACTTVWSEIEQDLRDRGVEVRSRQGDAAA